MNSVCHYHYNTRLSVDDIHSCNGFFSIDVTVVYTTLTEVFVNCSFLCMQFSCNV